MDLLTIAKLVVKDGMNGFTTYQVGKDIPDVRQQIRCVSIDHSVGGYTVVGESGAVYIDVKEEFVVKRVTVDSNLIKE